MHALAVRNRGDIHYELKRFEAAWSDYNKAVALEDKNASNYLRRGNASFIKLEVKLSDPAAVAFYEKLGMTRFEGEGIMLLGGDAMPALADF